MRHRRDHTDYAERGVLGNAQPVVAADGVGGDHFHARHLLTDNDELLNLVVGPADLRLFQLDAAKFLGLRDDDVTNALNRLLALLERLGPELALRVTGCGHGIVNAVEYAESTGQAGAS